MIKLNVKSETIGGLFGLDPKRSEQLSELLEAAANAFVRNLLNSNEPSIFLDKASLIDLFATYAEGDAEFAFCIFHAGQSAKSIELMLNENYIQQ